MSNEWNNMSDVLLESFNKRNPEAFGVVYRKFYRELFLYANHLFEPLNLSAEDIIQDIVCDIWRRKTIQFTSLAYFKTFCFIAIKNAYKNKIKHLDVKHYFELEYKVEHEFSHDIERAELYNNLYDSIKLLPPDYSSVLRMYLEGWKPEEIAVKLGIALQTVYNKRREGILLLRKLMIK